jgi:hypothetical protein
MGAGIARCGGTDQQGGWQRTGSVCRGNELFWLWEKCGRGHEDRREHRPAAGDRAPALDHGRVHLGNGAGGALRSDYLRITFDRDTGQVEHRSLRPFGSRSKFLDLAKVTAARQQADWRDSVRMTRLVLETEDGTAALEYGFGNRDLTELETAVNAWLTRPG